MRTSPRRMGGEGSGVQLGGEQQEPTPITLEPQAIPTLEADPIGVFAPGAGPEERALRKRLHNAWTISSARASRSKSDTARALWWQVSLAASEWTFARSSNADLKDVADALARVFLAASAFERIEGGAA